MLAAVVLVATPLRAEPRILVDVENGTVIEHEDAFRQWQPASLTKLMTVLLAFRAIEEGRATPDTPVVMSERASALPASKMYWKPGTSVPLMDAVRLLIVKSANDVSSAVAETLGGTEENFVAMMNAEARRLGMTATSFRNPHGLPDGRQLTNARDMAVLGRAIRRDFPQYDPIFRLEALEVIGKPVLGYNLILGRFQGADGMKTGFVCASGFNIVTTASRGGRTMLAVVLGAPSQERRAEWAVEMLEEGFTKTPDDLVSLPTLDTLKPYDEDALPANLRSEICTAEARANRYDGRDVEGRMVLNTDLITPRTRAPITARIFPFPPLPEPRERPPEPATGPNEVLYGDRRVPSPEPLPFGRPDDPLFDIAPDVGDGATDEADLAENELDTPPAAAVPVRVEQSASPATLSGVARSDGARPLPRLPDATRSFAPATR